MFHCNACQQDFNSVGAFDAHRTGTYRPVVARRCLTVAEMEAQGFSRNRRNLWIATLRPEDANERLRHQGANDDA